MTEESRAALDVGGMLAIGLAAITDPTWITAAAGLCLGLARLADAIREHFGPGRGGAAAERDGAQRERR